MTALPPPVHVYQLDGSAWGPSACMGAAAAMALDAYTGGRVRVGMAAIRAAQNDRSGGIGLDDVAQAWRRGWGLDFVAGAAPWPTIRARLRAREGVIITANYRALGRWRAPGSTFAGAHALYLARLDGAAVTVHDPLRRGPTMIPESAVQLAYTGGSGWGRGSYGGKLGAGFDGVFERATSSTLGAWGNLVSFPVGHIITAADVDTMMAALKAGGFFDGELLDPLAGEGTAAKTTRTILSRHVGERWDKALQDRIQSELQGAALSSNAFGIAVTDALAGLPATLQGAALVLGLVGLGLLGVFLTFREPLTVALPPAARRLTR